jgi:hypothetical protein
VSILKEVSKKSIEVAKKILFEKTSKKNNLAKVSKKRTRKLIKIKLKRENLVRKFSLISSIIIMNKNKTATAPT